MSLDEQEAVFNLIRASKIMTSVGYQGKNISLLNEDLFCSERSAFICCIASIKEEGRDSVFHFLSVLIMEKTSF